MTHARTSSYSKGSGWTPLVGPLIFIEMRLYGAVGPGLLENSTWLWWALILLVARMYCDVEGGSIFLRSRRPAISYAFKTLALTTLDFRSTITPPP